VRVPILSLKKNILVVDDDENICDTLKDILESEGYNVDTASTGDTAVRKAIDTTYALVLLDVKLPDISGLEVLQKIRKQTPRTIIIMITGYPTLDTAAESINQGAQAYIMKPIRPEELLKFIAQKIKDLDINTKSLLDETLPNFIKLLQDGKLWTIDALAAQLGADKQTVEKISSFCLASGLVKYWIPQGIVQIIKK
jgi:DNA-binding response OmpR family regulator